MCSNKVLRDSVRMLGRCRTLGVYDVIPCHVTVRPRRSVPVEGRRGGVGGAWSRGGGGAVRLTAIRLTLTDMASFPTRWRPCVSTLAV